MKTSRPHNILFHRPNRVPEWASFAVVLVFAVVICAILYWNISEKRSFYLQSAQSRLELKTQALLDDIEQTFVSTEQTLVQLSDLPVITTQDLRRRVLFIPALEAMMVFDKDGVQTAGGGARAQTNRYSRLPDIALEMIQQGLRFHYEQLNGSLVVFRHTYDRDGQHIGSYMAVIHRNFFVEALQRHEIPPTYSAALFDSQQDIIWGMSGSTGVATTSGKLNALQGLQQLPVTEFAGRGLTRQITDEAVIVSQQMSAYALWVAISKPTELALENWREDQRTALLIGALVVSGALVFAILWRIPVRRQNQYAADLYQLYQVIDQTPVSFVMTDLDARVVYVNSTFTKYTGYTPDEIIGENPRVLQSGHTPKETYDSIWTQLTRGEPWRGELLNKRKDGTLYWEDALIAPMRNSRGEVTNYVAFKSNITESKVQQQQLQEVIWGTQSGTWLWDISQGSFIVNGLWAELQGYTLKNLPDQALDEWIGQSHPDDQAQVRRALQAHLAGRSQSFDCEYRVRHRDGHWVWICDRGQISDRAADGTALRMAGTRTDISERKALSIELSNSEAKYRRLVEQTSRDYFIYSHDTDGVFHYVSPSIETVLGYSADEFTTQFTKFLTDSPLNTAAIAHTQKSIEGAQQPSYELEIFHKNGSRRILEISEGPVFASDGTVIAVEGVAHDLTRRKQAEEEMAALQQALEMSNRDLQQFAYSISHDLQAPLRTVTSFLQLLVRRYSAQLDESAKDYIQFAVDGSTRMSQMITDLLSFSRVHTKGEPFVPTNLDGAFNDAKANLSAHASELDAVITASPLPEVTADPSQMMRLMQNIIENALKYHHPNRPPHINVSAVMGETHWTVAIADNGKGIDEIYFNKVFSLFNRADAREDTKGTGVGLAVCQRIVERHGGKIWLESTVGEGTTFYFTLPKE